jgi:hypothetical protein
MGCLYGMVQERADSFVWANGFGAFAETKAHSPKAIGTRLPILSTQKLQQ